MADSNGDSDYEDPDHESSDHEGSDYGDPDYDQGEPSLFDQPTGSSRPEEGSSEDPGEDEPGEGHSGEGHASEGHSGEGHASEGDASKGNAVEEGPRWPPQERFPLNLNEPLSPGQAARQERSTGREGSREERSVGETVRKIYRGSGRFLAVTAFTSLEHLLSFFGENPPLGENPAGERQIDIVLGSEPSPATGGLYESTRPVAQQARDYWLRRGVSVLSGGGALRLLRAVEEGQVRFHAAGNLHAKIYVGDGAAVFGSSNFSRQGMAEQQEANARFEAGSGRYRELRAIAEKYLEGAEDRTEEIASLIRDLLRPVTWQEALARGAAEILEGDWTDRYPEAFRLLQEEDLWPHQERAIAQGLWILDTRGSVLVADATGSGKTRIGTHLLYGLLNRLWAQGQVHRTDATVVCPPQVTGEWEREIRRSEAAEVSAISHGMLSQGRNAEAEREEVRQANVLFLDEAHNYLSRTSKRSKAITTSASDYSALLTATPINRGTGDLLRMIELLGLDNLSDREFRAYKELQEKASLTAGDERQLREIVRQCTIRRTKQDLNQIVSRRPEGYAREDGTVYRFPEHNCRTYRTGETARDKRLAEEIGELAEELRGLQWLRKFKAPPWTLGNAEKEKALVERRVKGADGLSTHVIRRALQSSKAALLEIVYGTEKAAEMIGLEEGLKTRSGDFLSAVGELLEDPPEEKSNLEEASPPSWLTESPEETKGPEETEGSEEAKSLKETVETERRTLREIGQKARELSKARTQARAEKIREIAREEPLVLAFGAKPLTLHALRDCLQGGSGEGSGTGDTSRAGDSSGNSSSNFWREVVVADGSMPAGRRQSVKEKLGLGGSEQTNVGPGGEGKEGLVALCSDAMSEGLNLQRASSVVLLDTPSVIRIAEQRVGRIDRMDSPHEQIDVWWPADSRPFQSARRGLLIERYNANERLLGNNIDLPDAIGGEDEIFSEEGRRRASATALIEKYEAHQETGPEHRLGDAFRPVRELVGLASSGEQEKPPLVPKETYQQVAGADATVWSRVSIVRAGERPPSGEKPPGGDKPPGGRPGRWGFFCLRGQEGRAPRWILVEEGKVSEGKAFEGKPFEGKPGLHGHDGLGGNGGPGGNDGPGGHAGGTLPFGEEGWSTHVRLGPISRRLRALLRKAEPTGSRGDPALFREAEGPLGEMLGAIRESERDLLSNKARHGLGLLQKLAAEYKARPTSEERMQACRFLSKALSGNLEAPCDIQDLADRWLGLVQPRYVEWKRAQRSAEVARMKDEGFTKHLLHEPIRTGELRRLAENTQRQEPVGRRLAAAIVAIPPDGEE
ncbi:SNF2-related protein [Salinibacter ruber]|uniref:SNF2-related protein n=1 Tax=Salinibacter ruber TaxID=146919 RepID=UPI0020740ADD|nr:SNF2-related protein [Salinibacter ruber]